jgi:acyl-CoA synthetase (NDP forming)
MQATRLWMDWGTFEAPSANRVEVADSNGSSSREWNALVERFRRGSATDTAVGLDEYNSKMIIKVVGILTTAPIILDPNESGALAALSDLPYPVVVKVLSGNIVHKASVGGVVLNLHDPAAALKAAQDIAAKFSGESSRGMVLVEPMVTGRREWFIGARRDAAFGTVLTIGVGGADVERSGATLVVGATSPADVRARLADAQGETARQLGATDGVDRELAKIGGLLLQLFGSVPSLKEIDINPLMESTNGLIAVDAVVVA